MDVRPQIAPSESSKALSASFNQDNTCFAVGLESGFSIFHSDPCRRQGIKKFGGGIGIVEMLGRSNFLALVGGGRSPKFPQTKVIIWNDSKGVTAFSLEFRSEIKAARISRSRIIVVLLNSVHVYAFSQPPDKLNVFETHDNPLGLCVLSNKTLAFPGRTPGHLQLLDIASSNVTIIPAHTTPLSAIAISPAGDLIATASQKGTLIRVYSTATSSKIAELRRGLDRATIFSIAISPSSRRLAVTSDKMTLHVFDLPAHGAPGSSSTSGPTGSSNSSSGSDNKRWSLLANIPLLPKYFSSEWSFAHATFEGGGRGTLGWTNEGTIVLVSSGEGDKAKWEKFVLCEDTDTDMPGTLQLLREGWRRYLEND